LKWLSQKPGEDGVPPEGSGPVAGQKEALGTLAGGIAHSFSTLLMGIHGNASLSLMRTDPAERSDDYLKKINQRAPVFSYTCRQLMPR
jgi:hypothetical protein